MFYKLFSRRQAESKGEVSDVYIYDKIPKEFRNQYVHILFDAIYNTEKTNSLYYTISKRYSKEIGLLSLNNYSDSRDSLLHYILESSDKGFIDFLDFSLLFIESHNYDFRFKANEIIADVNYRLQYHRLGYEYSNGSLIRIDNILIHREAVKPSLTLLSDPRFSGANDEMRKAYEFRRQRDNKNAIIEACKAFESTMKSICTIKVYTVEPRASASTLIQTLKEHQYFPSYLDTHLHGLKATLESGLPTVRNRNAGHGQGEEVVSVPDAYVDYALNLLATNIVFLVKLLNP